VIIYQLQYRCILDENLALGQQFWVLRGKFAGQKDDKLEIFEFMSG
jgi:hypothetical protein